MAKRSQIRMVDLWIQALTEASDDTVIAAALRKQIREVHDFFADVIRDGQRRGVIHADRDPVAEAWIFVAGGLLATMDNRLGGLLGDDLQRVRTERRRWMLGTPVGSPAGNRPQTRESPGCGTRGSPWSGGAPVGRSRVRLCGPAGCSELSPLARSPCTRPGVRPSVQGALTVRAMSAVCQVARSSDFRLRLLTAIFA